MNEVEMIRIDAERQNSECVPMLPGGDPWSGCQVADTSGR